MSEQPPEPPEQTRDDTDEGWGEAPVAGAGHDVGHDAGHDDWLREQRPPHWD